MVAGSEVGDLVADRFDDPGRLVAHDRRRRMRVDPLDEVQVAVAQPGGHGAHQHLARPDGSDADLFDRQVARGSTQHSCSHDSIPHGRN